MCGRFTLRSSPRVVAELFGLDEVPNWEPRYNVAPSQLVPVVQKRAEDRGRHLDLVHWGLVPFWADDPAIGNRLINARSDTAATKPAFRAAMRERRCLVVADGFYEWQAAPASGAKSAVKRGAGKASGGHKQPFLIERHDRRPFAFAGLWEKWQSPDGPWLSCTILTTDANHTLSPLHHRMPVILDPRDYDHWLDPAVRSPAEVEDLLLPAPDDWLVARPVGTYVNNPRHDSRECVEPVTASASEPPGPSERMLF
ncbi:MAG: SOS response-associated peptidase [Pirellulales bacterium]|nr:SOS response-associated peptidase [Pirellulales bacterium]